MSPCKALHRELCVFADTSVKAISAVAYLKVRDHDGHTEVGFSEAKLAPQSEFPIPRLELCAAVLAVKIAEVIVEEIEIETRLNPVTYRQQGRVGLHLWSVKKLLCLCE